MLIRRRQRMLALLVVMALVAAIMAGCGSKVNEGATTPGQTPMETATSDPGGASTDQEATQPSETTPDTAGKEDTHKIGEPVQLGDRRYTVNGVRVLEGEGNTNPAKGYRWIAVDITAENTGKQDAEFSSMLQFRLKDQDGYEYNVSFLPVRTKGTVDGVVKPGDKLRGEVTFEVQESATAFQLIIDDSAFGSGTATVDLGEVK